MFTPNSPCNCIGADFYVKQFFSSENVSPIFSCLYFGKLPETAVIKPSYEAQLVGPSALNRYIERVSVSRIPVILSTVSLAVAAEATYTFSGASSVSSADVAVATAEIADGVVTITGVAAGTTDVTVLDISGNSIATITVTVA